MYTYGNIIKPNLLLHQWMHLGYIQIAHGQSCRCCIISKPL